MATSGTIILRSNNLPNTVERIDKLYQVIIFQTWTNKNENEIESEDKDVAMDKDKEKDKDKDKDMDMDMALDN